MVQVIGFEGVTRDRIGVRPVLTTIFGALLLVLFILVLYAPPLRRFFDIPGGPGMPGLQPRGRQAPRHATAQGRAGQVRKR